MTTHSNRNEVACEFFQWKLFQRSGIWYADGRSSKPNLGKHSLATRSREEALKRLAQLDRKKAVEHGLAENTKQTTASNISISDGWQRFLDYCNRPEVMGGVSPATYKRYRAVRDKHIQFCSSQSLSWWTDITKQATEKYGNWLARRKYADRSLYLELSLIKGVVNWLAEEELIPESCRFKLSLRRPEGTDTYCYSREEVRTMVELTSSQESLHWLHDVILTLACTGLRISELLSLRASDIDLDSNTLTLSDDRASSRRKQLGTARRTKGRRSRTLPIHPDLRGVLERKTSESNGFLFRGTMGGKLKPDTIRTRLIRDVLTPLKSQFPVPEGEIGFEHGRLHSFRHYFVSQAFLCGASEGEIMEWVGHRDSKMVSHYRHLKNEDSQRKMQQINFLGTESDSEGLDHPT